MKSENMEKKTSPAMDPKQTLISSMCKHCGSPELIKNGKIKSPTSVYQKYRCKTCGRCQCKRLDRPELDPSFQAPPSLPRDPQRIDWSAYNEAQMQEKLLFLDILEDLCSRLPEEEIGKVGRPRASTREMAFCMAAKLYEGLSSRRVSSDLEIAMQRGHITKVPHFNCLLKYLNDSAMTSCLTNMIRLSAVPLKGFETTFAVDSSGLSSAFYSRWLDERIKPVKEHEWVKVHLMCGVKSGIVTSIEVSDGHSNDSPHFPKLLNDTAQNFRVKEVCADKGYISRSNLEAAFDVGAVPYIPFKSNTTGKAKGSLAWQRMFYYYRFHEEQFMERYHQRSNVESTFSSLKRKFSSKLMMKGEVGQVNEALAMVLCYNITVLVREAFENGITAEFGDAAHLFPSLEVAAH